MTTLYTIGYEGTDIDRFVETLKVNGVELLADVRALPLSRKEGFSKSKLRLRAEREGISYLHLGALGDPKEGRDAARKGRFEAFRNIYTNHISSPKAQENLHDLASLVELKTTCLMCYERDPAHCHRLIVVSHLPPTVRAFHLFGDEPVRYVRNRTKISSGRAREGVASTKQDLW
jgi:uncharacterized protein (DUF488 family)